MLIFYTNISISIKTALHDTLRSTLIIILSDTSSISREKCYILQNMIELIKIKVLERHLLTILLHTVLHDVSEFRFLLTKFGNIWLFSTLYHSIQIYCVILIWDTQFCNRENGGIFYFITNKPIINNILYYNII